MEASVGIVVPAYRPDVQRLVSYVRDLDGELSPATIRIELDAPDEGVVGRLESDLPATASVAAADRRRGKGTAITAGFEALDTEVLAFVDADGSTPVDSVASVLAPVLEGRADLSVGSRRHPEATVASHQTFARRRLGDAFAWLARQLVGVDLHDFQCGAKALTSDAWGVVRTHLHDSGFAWDLELIAMAVALDLHIAEVPIEWHDQPGSTVSTVSTTLDLARALVTARHRAKRLGDSRLHDAIAAGREEPTTLVEAGAGGPEEHERKP
jgi:hypothetical protein